MDIVPGQPYIFYYYNDPLIDYSDETSHPKTGYMDVYISGSVVAVVYFQSELRAGTFFGISTTGGYPYLIGIFPDGITTTQVFL